MLYTFHIDYVIVIPRENYVMSTHVLEYSAIHLLMQESANSVDRTTGSSSTKSTKNYPPTYRHTHVQLHTTMPATSFMYKNAVIIIRNQ